MNRFRAHVPAFWLPILAVVALAAAFSFPLLFQGQTLCGGDIVNHYGPYRSLVKEQLSGGTLPHWNPYTFGGRPLLADIQNGVFYPLNLLFWLLPLHHAFDLSFLLHLLLGLSGMALWMKRFCRGWVGPLFGAVVFCLSGFAMSRLLAGIVLFLQTMAWLPWLLYFRDRLHQSRDNCDGRGPWWWMALVLAAACSLLAGSPQIAFYGWLALLLYELLNGWGGQAQTGAVDGEAEKGGGFPLKGMAILLSSLLLAGLITAVQLLPTKAFMDQSWDRSGDAEWEYITGNSPRPHHLITFVSPFFFGDPRDEAHYWGPAGYHEVTAWCGPVPLFLFFLYLLGRWTFLRRHWHYERMGVAESRRLEIFALLLIGGGLLLAGGSHSPLFWLAFHLAPGFDRFREPGRLLLFVVLGLAILSGLTLDRLGRYHCPKNKAGLIHNPWIAPVLLVFLLGVALAGVLSRFVPELFAAMEMPFLRLALQKTAQAAHWQNLVDQMEKLARLDLLRFGLQWMAAGLVSLFLVSLGGMKKNPRTLVLILQVHLLVFAAGECLWYSMKCMDRCPQKEIQGRFYPRTDRVQWLEKTLKPGERFLWMDSLLDYRHDQFQPELLTNRPLLYRLPQLRGYDPVNSRRYGLFMNMAMGLPPNTNPLGQMRMPDTANPAIRYDLLSLWNTAVVMSYALQDGEGLSREQQWRFGPQGRFQLQAFHLDSYGPAFLRDPLFVPEAFNLKEQAVLLRDDQFDPALQALLPMEAAAFFSQDKAPSGHREKVELLESGLASRRFRVKSSRNRVLVLSESYYPGWKASVNGEPTAVYPANLAQCAVAVPSGVSEVHFFYRPAAFRQGMLVSLGALLLLFLLVARFRQF